MTPQQDWTAGLRTQPVLTSSQPSDWMQGLRTDKPVVPPPPKEPLPAGLTEPTQGGLTDTLMSTAAEFVKVPAQALYGAGKFAVNTLIDPLSLNETIPEAVATISPVSTEFPKIMDSIKAGRLDYGLIHSLNALIPGWKMTSDQIQSWIHRAPADGPRVAAEMFWSIAPFLKGAGASTGAVAAARLRDPNPAMAAAIDTARAEGVNVPAGAATGRPILTGAQELADRATLSGGLTASTANDALREQMTAWGDRLTKQAHPTATDSLQAGERVIKDIKATASKYNAEAAQQYGAIEKRQAAAPTVKVALRPARVGPNGVVLNPEVLADVQMPVDLRPAHRALSTITQHFQDVLDAGGTLTSAEADANRVLKNFVNGEDFASLTTAEDVLSTIKAAYRKASTAETRALLTQAKNRLDAQIMQRAAQEGGDIVTALSEGRINTAKKYTAEDLLAKDLGVKDVATAEPAKVAEKIINASNDQRAQLVTRLEAVAPNALPELGRASLQKILDVGASAENGLGRAQTMLDRWQAMGDKTKRLLFKDAIAQNPNYLRDVEQFFRVAQRLQKQINPSGTAGSVGLAQHVAGAVKGGGLAVGAILGGEAGGLAGSIVGSMMAEGGGYLTSKLLRSPKFVAMLVEQTSPSFRMLPVAQQAARSTALAQLFHETAQGQMFGAAPALASADSTAPPPTGIRR